MVKQFHIDLEALDEDIERLGIKLIAITDNPAIEIKGIALSKEKEKKVIFENEKKLQIAGPLLIPKNIYRYDDEDGEYEIIFTSEAVESVVKHMMKTLPKNGNKSIFTDEHSDKFINAYLFEILLVDSKEKQSMLKSMYGYDMPIGGAWITVQVENKEDYDYLVENGKIGFSIDGRLRFKEEEKVKFKKQNKMKKVKLTKKVKFREGFFKHTSKTKIIAFEADKIEEKEEVTVYDEDGNAVEDWSGEIEIVVDGEETSITIEDDVITSVEVVDEEEESEKETEAEKEKETEAEEEEEEKKVEQEEVVTPDFETLLNSAIEPILESLVRIEALISKKESDDEEDVQMSKPEKRNKALEIILKRSGK